MSPRRALARWIAAAHLLPFVFAGACALPDGDFDADGWTTRAGDCDDFDPEVHPEAEDPVADGFDQDCDGIESVLRVEGAGHTCELSDEGQVFCWGANEHGQTDVPDMPRPVVDLAAGRFHTCALEDVGIVSCWGDDSWGQSSPPSSGPFADIDAGDYWTIGVLSEAKARAICWGLCAGANRP